MTGRTVVLRPAAQRDLSRMAREDQDRILQALERFATTGAGDIKMLHGRLAGFHRLRVGKWRLIISLAERRQVLVLAIDNRGEAY